MPNIVKGQNKYGLGRIRERRLLFDLLVIIYSGFFLQCVHASESFSIQTESIRNIRSNCGPMIYRKHDLKFSLTDPIAETKTEFGQTSLYQMGEHARGQGFYVMGIRTEGYQHVWREVFEDQWDGACLLISKAPFEFSLKDPLLLRQDPLSL